MGLKKITKLSEVGLMNGLVGPSQQINAGYSYNILNLMFYHFLCPTPYT